MARKRGAKPAAFSLRASLGKRGPSVFWHMCRKLGALQVYSVLGYWVEVWSLVNVAQVIRSHGGGLRSRRHRHDLESVRHSRRYGTFDSILPSLSLTNTSKLHDSLKSARQWQRHTSTQLLASMIFWNLESTQWYWFGCGSGLAAT